MFSANHLSIWYHEIIMHRTMINIVSASLIFLTTVMPVFAQTPSPSGQSFGAKLDKELQHFKEKGAKGYLIWQYSGDQNNPLGDTDKYSIFRQNLGDPGNPTTICGGMKKWAGQFEFLGYNVYSLGNGRGGPLSSGQIADHLNSLKACGTNVVRVFISRSCPGNVPECVNRMLAGAGAAGVKLILTVGDFANGGGGFPKLSRDQVAAWYGGGYKSSAYPQILAQTIQASRGNGNLYGIEPANEPHCYDDASAVAGYNQWARSGLGQVKGAGIGNAGLGQMGNNPRSSCDGPNTNLIPGNKQAGASMVSSHYYSEDERAQADIAADKVNAAGMKFYIGEAPLAGFLSTSCGEEEWGCKVSFGEVLDNTAGTAPWRVHDVTNTKPTTGSIITTQGIDIDESKLFLDVKELYGDNVPFADFTKDDTKLSEALDPRIKESLIPAALHKEVAYPNQQVDTAE
ncbi:hypothetical protein HYV22_02900 [Candidatus Gottesmanbacteria bacterium]|nr:hypothetical protein [Candidatus Gottesmanbacteria bacterium]